MIEKHLKLAGLIAIHGTAVISAVAGGVFLAIAKTTKWVQILRAFWLFVTGFVSAKNALRNKREGSGAHCTWTQKENELRDELGLETYSEPYIEHYSGLSLKVQQFVGALLFLAVLVRFLRNR